MAAIRIDQFKGLIPRIHPSLLPEGCASIAHNCRIKNGKVCPLRDVLKVSDADIWLENGLTDIGNAKTIYPWTRVVGGEEKLTFLAWPDEVDVAQGNIYNDDYSRIFVSGKTGIPNSKENATEPSVYLSNESTGAITRRSLVKLALPAPSVTLVSGGNANSELTRYTYFYQTWVDKYGYESPASDQSEEIAYNDGDTVTIGAVDKPDGAVLRRIYKVITGTESENIQFIKELSGVLAFASQDITVKDEDAGEVIDFITAPPEDLCDMIYVPGSYYAGWSRSNPKSVMFSAIDLPYNWPVANRYDVRDEIVALASTANTVYVLTNGRPWILRGTAPDTMQVSSLTPAACVAKRSVCVWRNNVYYATNFGLCMIHNDSVEGEVVTNITDKFFTKQQWAELNPASCRMYLHDSALHAFFTKEDGTEVSYIFDLTEQECMVTTHDEHAVCSCVDHGTDDMYIIRTEES